jgi:hypothetical protein
MTEQAESTTATTTTTTETHESCAKCLYYQSTSHFANGYCRRYPPQVVPPQVAMIAVWPDVTHYDWCGEFRWGRK